MIDSKTYSEDISMIRDLFADTRARLDALEDLSARLDAVEEARKVKPQSRGLTLITANIEVLARRLIALEARDREREMRIRFLEAQLQNRRQAA